MTRENHTAQENRTDQQPIRVYYADYPPLATTPDEMANIAGRVFPAAERMNGAAGEAFDLREWFANWKSLRGVSAEESPPTHLKVEAADGFEALIPWEQTKDAAVQFAVDGKPLGERGPVRLFVPNGSSECLNVKRVVACRFLWHDEADEGASYGFKRVFSAEEMRYKRE